MSSETKSFFGLTGLEVCSSIFITTEENIKFELYQHIKTQFPWDVIKRDGNCWSIERIGSEVLYEYLEYENEKALDISDISDKDLHDEKKGPLGIGTYKKIIKNGGYATLLERYVEPVLHDFESYLKIGKTLQIDINMILKRKISYCTTYERPTAIFTARDIFQALQLFGLQIEYVDIIVNIFSVVGNP